MVANVSPSYHGMTYPTSMAASSNSGVATHRSSAMVSQSTYRILRQAEGFPGVRVFDAPRADARLLGEIASGEQVQCLREQESFVEVISRSGKRGWVGIKNIADTN